MCPLEETDDEDWDIATITLSLSGDTFTRDDIFDVKYGHDVAPPPLAFIEVDGDVYYDPAKLFTTTQRVRGQPKNRYERPTGVPNSFNGNKFLKTNVFSLTHKTRVDFMATLQCRIEAAPGKVFEYLKDSKNWNKWHSLIRDVHPWNSKGLPKEGYIRTVVMKDGCVRDEEFVAWEENKRFIIGTLATDEPTITSQSEEYRFDHIYSACETGNTKSACLLTWTVAMNFDSWVAQQKHSARWTFAGRKDDMIYVLDTLAELFDEDSDCKDFEL